MDFVPSRKEEKRYSWRTRVREFLQKFGAIVYDPWFKPIIIGQDGYGDEYEYSSKKRSEWTFEESASGRKTRAQLCRFFAPTVHINRRMVDICDFLVAYCPTNVYSVGTVNEIVRARRQHKPVLLVSPPINYPALDNLAEHLKAQKDEKALQLLEQLKGEAPLKPNPDGVPSPWYLALMNDDYFFDGFGYALYSSQFNWTPTRLDDLEEAKPPQRPLLPYLEKLDRNIPQRYDAIEDRLVENPDWLILEPGVHEPA
ncbi:MAG: hypothetical protein C5B53_03100 [Candidatus Melainabacteria bacterium]|nr:MAG: hypothetical protein C5B53_03100 [Candidatus Melainabacteria bacterium]